MTKNSWVLILGANSDMAVALAKRFAREGYNIYLASRNVSECLKNAADIEIRYKVDVKVLVFDALNFGEHSRFYSSLPVKPQVAIVAFGFMSDQKLAQVDFSLAKMMIDTNYMGSVSILEHIASDFEERKQGFIVGLSSVAGDRGRMSNYIYGSTKAAFSTYLDGLRHRLIKSNVNVLTVKPGFVDTKMTTGLELPRSLTAKPELVANAIFKAVQNKKSIVYVTSIWFFIMFIIKRLPNFIFHKTKL